MYVNNKSMKRILLYTLALMCATLSVQAQRLNANVEETTSGQAWDLTFTLAEVSRHTALSLQITLPEQLKVAGTSLSDALKSSHELRTGQNADGTLKIILYSPQSTLLPGQNAAFTLQLQAADGEALIEETYTLALTDIRFADAQGVETKLDDSSVVLQNTPSAPGLSGDVNNDGALSAADVVTLLNVLEGLPTDNYLERCADMDGNGRVDADDVAALRNQIMEQPASTLPQEPLPAATIQVRPTETTLPTEDKGVAQLMVEVTENLYSALQMNISLPQSVRLESISLPPTLQGMESSLRLLEDGTYRLMLYASGKTTLPKSRVALSLHVATGEAVEGSLRVTAATASTHLGTEERMDDNSAAFKVQKEATDIRQLPASSAQAQECYDLQGRRISLPARGVVILNGKKYYRSSAR